MRSINASSKTDPVRWWMLLGVWLIYSSFGLVASSLAPLTTRLVSDLGVSLSEMGRILGAWQFVYLFSAIPLGIAIDRVGLRWTLFIAVALIALSALLRSVAVDAVSLWLAVGVFGLGGPLISIGAPKVISLWFSSEQRGTAMGLYMTGPAVGSIVALSMTNSVLLPLFDDQWRPVFVLYAACVFLVGVVWLLIDHRFGSRQPAAQDINSPSSSRVPAFTALLRVPVVRLVLLMSVLVFIYSHGLGNWLPAILQEKGFSEVEAGYWASLPIVVGIAASVLLPRLARGRRRFILLTIVCVVAGLSIVALLLLEGSALFPGLVALGIARATMMTLCILVLMEAPEVGSRAMGTAGGLFFAFAEIGGVCGPAGIGWLRDWSGSFELPLLLLVGITGLLIILSLLCRRLAT